MSKLAEVGVRNIGVAEEPEIGSEFRAIQFVTASFGTPDELFELATHLVGLSDCPPASPDLD